MSWPPWIVQSFLPPFIRIPQAQPSAWLWVSASVSISYWWRLSDDSWASHQSICIAEYHQASLHWHFSHSNPVWFYLRSLGHPASESWHPRHCQVWAHSCGVSHWLTTLRTSVTSLPPSPTRTIQAVGQRLCGCMGVLIFLLEILPGHRWWLVPPFLGVLAGVIVDSWEFPLHQVFTWPRYTVLSPFQSSLSTHFPF